VSDATAVCFSCGRCCFGQTDYVQVFDDDLKELGAELADRLVAAPVGPNERFMKMQDGHCAALDTSGGQYRCSIYEQRPLICRVYKMYASSSACPPQKVTSEASTPRR
jgi:Fe-S-cluster containining protein